MEIPPYIINGNVSIHQYINKTLKDLPKDQAHILTPPANTLSPYELEHVLNHRDQFIPALLFGTKAYGKKLNSQNTITHNTLDSDLIVTIVLVNKTQAFHPNKIDQPQYDNEILSNFYKQDIELPNVVPIGIIKDSVQQITENPLIKNLISAYALPLMINGYDILIRPLTLPKKDLSPNSYYNKLNKQFNYSNADAIFEISHNTEIFKPNDFHQITSCFSSAAYCPAFKIIDPIYRYEMALSCCTLSEHIVTNKTYDDFKIKQKDTIPPHELNIRFARLQQALDAAACSLASLSHAADYILFVKYKNITFHDFMIERFIDQKQLFSQFKKINTQQDAKKYKKDRIDILASRQLLDPKNN